ncbi:hypothetical protein [Shimia sagamensis]|uniref:DUF4123 domain-containing protein n=1 Tax=Shimia sagamensis TaxID=1566352 RepID=A0ABY1P4P8_9RHOB|nr:hypothetical protein [Shimia sagamensis]SMP26491.1 hypothetical protein SAMN06265373_105253 [Shimia sagamensis]
MKLSLDGPIWTRLYGPYGVQPVASTLESLSCDWQQAVADDLYWERLHHQETLYPVTYAALPWLWEIAPKDAANLDFFSQVLFCATAPDGDALNGLDLDVTAHAHKWLAQDILLTWDDMNVLSGPRDWFLGHKIEIADACLAALPQTLSESSAAHLLAGPCVCAHAATLAEALRMVANGLSTVEIGEDLEPFDSDDKRMLQRVLPRIEQSQPALALGLRDVASHMQVLQGLDPIWEDCTKTGDLFTRGK